MKFEYNIKYIFLIKKNIVFIYILIYKKIMAYPIFKLK